MFAKTFVLTALAALAVAAPAPKEVDDSSISGTSNVATFYDLSSYEENDGHPNQVACPNNDGVDNNSQIVAMKGGQDNCGKQIIVTDKSTGKEETFTVADECSSCADGQLDFPLDTWLRFGQVAKGQGELQISWRWA